MKTYRFAAGLAAAALSLQTLLPASVVLASTDIVLNAVDFGADPYGIQDSSLAIQKVLDEAKKLSEDGKNSVTVEFPQGEYSVYKDYSPVREVHTSNTDSADYPEKTFGILIEDQKNLTIEGNGSLFNMHGNMSALGVLDSENITLSNFSWDFAAPMVHEMTVSDMYEENGLYYVDFFIPASCPYTIENNTIVWHSDVSPYTGEYYWSETGNGNAYCYVYAENEKETANRGELYQSPFNTARSFEEVEGSDGRFVRASFGSKQNQFSLGMVLEFCSSWVRETAGAFTYESKNVVADGLEVHGLHAFGWLVQMSEDVTYRNCTFGPREGSGRQNTSYADGIHVSGASGTVTIEDCKFSDMHDDPINIHGTFTRAERVIDSHTLQLNYIHRQQGGFPQFHEGDKVVFYSRDTLESADNETEYTVKSVLANPGEDGNDLKTMVIEFEEELPSYLSETISGEPKYVAENITYSPQVVIRGNEFRNIPTRGILCTVRGKTLIEDNLFMNMSMASIYLSNDANEWYESGPIRDMTIRNNTFYVYGDRVYDGPAIWINPITKGGGLPDKENAVHQNITIEGNTFYMESQNVVKAESVKNLVIKNNTILRKDPQASIELSADTNVLAAGQSTALETNTSASTMNSDLFTLTKCSEVTIEGNTIDDGMKTSVVYSGMNAKDVTVQDDLSLSTSSLPASASISDLVYASSNPAVLTVDENGLVKAVSEGTAEIYAWYEWNGTLIESNRIEMTVEGTAARDEVSIIAPETTFLTEEGEKLVLKAEGSDSISWSVTDVFENNCLDYEVLEDGSLSLSAKANGAAIINALGSSSQDQIVICVSLETTPALSSDFTMIRENKSNYELTKNSYTVKMENGDLYNNDNTVKNLLLYPVSSDFTAIVRASDLPVRESGQWDTGSFLIYQDDDNYISIGKKSHFDGFAMVVEKNGSAAETGGSSDYNNIQDAWLAIEKSGSTVTLSFSSDKSEWTKLFETDGSFLNGNLYVGFAAWHSNNRGKSVTFSDFGLGEDLNQAASSVIPFAAEDTGCPEVKDLSVEKDGLKVTPSFTLSDGSAAKDVLYCYELTALDGTFTRTFSTTASWNAPLAGSLKVTAYAANAAGRQARPASAQITLEDVQDGLRAVSINNVSVFEKGQDIDAVEFLIPESLEKVVLTVEADSSLSGAEHGSQVISTDKPVILTAGESTLTISFVKEASNKAGLESLSLTNNELNVQPGAGDHYFLVSKANNDVLNVKVPEGVTLSLYKGMERTPVEMNQKDETTYEVSLDYKNGLNSYYLISTAANGKTSQQNVLQVLYAAKSTAFLTSLKVNGTEADTFARVSGHRAVIEAESDAPYTYLQFNGQTAVNEALTIENLAAGIHTVTVAMRSEDGTIHTSLLSLLTGTEDSAELFSLSVNGSDVLPSMEENKASCTTVTNFASLSIEALDSGAFIEAKTANETLSGTGSLTGDIALYEGDSTVTVTVVSADKSSTKTYVLDFEKAAYLSDLEYLSSSYVGYGSIQKDKATEGTPITLLDDEGNEVIFEKGLGTHADSEISFDLSNIDLSVLEGFCGIDIVKKDSQYAHCVFTIELDGQVQSTTNEMRGSTPMSGFIIDISNVNILTLKTTQSSNNWDAHTDWALMKLTGSFPAAPEKTINTAELEAAIKEAEALNEADWTEESWKALDEALTAAKAVLEAPESQETVDKAEADLKAAVSALVKAEPVKPEVNVEKLEKALRSLKDLDQDLYTEESWKALTDAKEAAEKALKSDNQDEVNKALEALEDALASLKKDGQTVYRAYNPNDGDHLYTTNKAEWLNAIEAGWNDEGTAWTALKKSTVPVYRVYDKNSGEHHYTANELEKDTLVTKHGWKDEGIAWYSDPDKEADVHRLYNPNATGAGRHHYTTSMHEKNTLVDLGWIYENVGFYAMTE